MQSRSNSCTPFIAVLLLTAGTAWAETFEVTYKAPASGVSVSVNAPQTVTAPLLVAVCLTGDCQTAAVLGNGLYRVGGFISIANPKIVKNPKAKALPSSADVLVPVDVPVAITVRSNGELKGSYIVSCGVPFAFKPRQGYRYTATWTANSEACGIRMTERANEPADAPEVELTPLDLGAASQTK